jgi:hypothetical protein
MSPSPNKWLLFWLSLVLPGAGQLRAGSRTCVPRLAAAVLGYAGSLWTGDLGGLSGKVAKVAVFAGLGLASAEHAKRLGEPRRSESAGWPRQVTSDRACRRRIRTRITITTPMALDQLWRRVADLPRFLVIDPFHERVILMRERPATGVHVVLEHNAFGRRFERFGRILTWREGAEFAFSDLSRRGTRVGFPHAFFVFVRPSADGQPGSELSIEVRGKWTSRWIPPRFGRWWVHYVSCEHARLLSRAL